MLSNLRAPLPAWLCYMWAIVLLLVIFSPNSDAKLPLQVIPTPPGAAGVIASSSGAINSAQAGSNRHILSTEQSDSTAKTATEHGSHDKRDAALDGGM